MTNRLHEVEGSYITQATLVHEDMKIDKRSWLIPFLILLVLMIGAGVGLYLFYEKMRKMHLL